ITGHLPAHRRRCPAQPRRDLPARLTRRHPQRDLLPLSHRQAPAAHHPRPDALHPASLPEPYFRRTLTNPRCHARLTHPPAARPPLTPPPRPPPPLKTPASPHPGPPAPPFFTTTPLQNGVLRRLAKTAGSIRGKVSVIMKARPMRPVSDLFCHLQGVVTSP